MPILSGQDTVLLFPYFVNVDCYRMEAAALASSLNLDLGSAIMEYVSKQKLQ